MTVNRSDFQRRFKAEPDSGDRFIGMDTDDGSGDPFVTDLAGLAAGLAPIIATDTAFTLGFPSASAAHAFLADQSASLAASPAYAVATTTNKAIGQDYDTGKIYGVSTASGHWMTSDDGVNWTDRTYSPVSASPTGIGSTVATMHVTASYMFVVRADGKVFRAARDVFNAWTEITPATPSLPANTTGRPEILWHTGTALLYGTYGTAAPYDTGTGDTAIVWRSTDNGGTWSVVFRPTGAIARHIHAIKHDSATGYVYLSVGDEGGTFTEQGMWRSTDDGATWTKMNPGPDGRYGVSFVINRPAAETGRNLLITEGDGLNKAFLYAWDLDNSVIGSSPLEPILWPDTAAAGGSWRGTCRGIALTSQGNLIFISTSESGAVGTRDGLWLAKGPWFTRAVLLAELTGSTWVYQSTFITADGAYAINLDRRITLPKFQGQ